MLSRTMILTRHRPLSKFTAWASGSTADIFTGTPEVGYSFVASHSARFSAALSRAGDQYSSQSQGRPRKPKYALPDRPLEEQISKANSYAELAELSENNACEYELEDIAAHWVRAGKLSKVEGRANASISRSSDRLIAETVQAAPLFSPRHLAGTANGAARVGYSYESHSQLYGALSSAALASLDKFEPQSLSTFLWSLARAKALTSQVAPSLGDAAARLASQFSTRDLSICVWSFATAGRMHAPMFDAIGEVAARRIRGAPEEVSTQSIVDMAWAYATLQHSVPALSEALAAAALPHLRAAKARQVNSLSWSLAGLGAASAAYFDEVAATVKLEEFKSGQLIRLAGSMAFSGHVHTGLLDGICERVSSRGASAAELAELLGVCASAGHDAPALLDAYEARGSVHASAASPLSAHELGRVAASLAHAQRAPPRFLDALASHAEESLRSIFTEKGHSDATTNAAYGASNAAGHDIEQAEMHSAGPPDQSSSHATGHAALQNGAKPEESSQSEEDAAPHANAAQKPTRLNPSGYVAAARVLQFVHALAVCRHSAPSFLGQFAARLARHADALSPAELARATWSYATLGLRDERLFTDVAAAAAAKLHFFSANELAQIAWAYAAADVSAAEVLFSQDFAFRCDMLCRDADTNPRVLSSLHQFQLWCEERACSASMLSAPLRARCHAAFACTTAATPQPSILAALRSLGCEAEGGITIRCGYRLDAAVVWRGERVAIEPQRREDELTNTREPSGASALRRRQLCAFGWPRLLVVPSQGWHRREGESEAEALQRFGAFLRTELDRIVLAPHEGGEVEGRGDGRQSAVEQLLNAYF